MDYLNKTIFFSLLVNAFPSSMVTVISANIGSGAVGRITFRRMDDLSNGEKFFVEWTVCRNFFVDSFLVEKYFVEIYQSSSI